MQAPLCRSGHSSLLQRRQGAPRVLAPAPAPFSKTPNLRSRQQHACKSSKEKTDVVALGNICLDVVIPMDTLPPEDLEYRRQLLDTLTRAPPNQDAWELGGNCNFMIAAARLGLAVGSVGHIGPDMYGTFVSKVLKAESISQHRPVIHEDSKLLDSTLACFVLVDPNSKHSFSSRYDFGPWPLLQGIEGLPAESMQLLRHTRAVFTNGFVFDELPLEIVQEACREALHSGAAVFFDPGPRCFTMMEGSRRAALDTLLDLSNVVLMTEEEAKIVTGHTDPDLAARQVLARPGSRTEWCVVKLGKEGALLRCKAEGRSYRLKGMQVEVQDTVGCGDSFASAIVLGYISRHSIPATLALANAVGAATATGRGAGRNVARSEKVISLLTAAAADLGRDPEQRAAFQEALHNLSALRSKAMQQELAAG